MHGWQAGGSAPASFALHPGSISPAPFAVMSGKHITRVFCSQKNNKKFSKVAIVATFCACAPSIIGLSDEDKTNAFSPSGVQGGTTMKKELTELVFIIDRSGSMYGLTKDTIGGFNSMLDKQRSEEGSAFVSTVLFNNVSKVVHDREDIKSVAHMTDSDYEPYGSTALLDAVGGAVRHISNIHKYARKEDVPEKTLFVIITDGMENSSHTFSGAHVKSMIKERQEKYGWEFLFLGANMDAATAAEEIGIGSDRAVKYCCDDVGTELSYDEINKTVSSFRISGKISDTWKAAIEEDEKCRG